MNKPTKKKEEKKINFMSKDSQAKIRDIQTRIFYGFDKNKIEKAVVNTMVDEDFYITLMDSEKGIITALGNKNTLDLRFIAIIKENSDKNISVRFNINTVKTKSFNKKYKIVKNNLLYEYL